MKQFFETLKAHIEQHPPNYGDSESVLTMLYECHNENNPYDNEQIKEDFKELYKEILRLHSLGINNTRVAESCGCALRIVLIFGLADSGQDDSGVVMFC